MPQSLNVNRRIVLAARPSGAVAAEHFRLEQAEVPVPAVGQLLLRTVFLSLDPYMRGRMNDAPSYAPCVQLGAVMTGGAVSQVVASQHPDFQPGDQVMGYTGWQDYALSDGSGLTKLPADMAHPSLALGVLGMPGFTAYMGLMDIGQPKVGETVVVAAASGAVGAVVGQIAKIQGCRVVGIAGAPTSAASLSMSSASTPAWTAARQTFRPSWPRPARTASTSTSRTSAAPSSTRCCRCSTPTPACRCAA